MEEKLKKKLRLKRCLILLVVLVIVGVYIKIHIDKKNSKPQIVSKSTLEKVISVSDLSTFEAIYNGVAIVNNEEEPEEIDYYVSYEAKVKAGIDFEKVNVEVNEKETEEGSEKTIVVTLPKVKITDVNVDIASLDYIFLNKKANTETVSAQAYKKCIEDVTKESESTPAIYEFAQQNAKNIVEALINPFVKQLDDTYKLVIKEG